MQHGHIAKDYESTAITTEHLTQLLVPSATPNNNLIQKEKITGILELYYSNYSLPEYFGNLRSASQSESGNSFHNNVHFISSEGLECFCNNLSVGDNIALIHYSSVCGALGYIDDDILRYLEKEFSKVLPHLVYPQILQWTLFPLLRKRFWALNDGSWLAVSAWSSKNPCPDLMQKASSFCSDILRFCAIGIFDLFLFSLTFHLYKISVILPTSATMEK